MATTTYNPISKGPICSRMIGEDEMDREKNTYMNSTNSTSFIQFKPIPGQFNRAAEILKCMETEELKYSQAITRLEMSIPDKVIKTMVNSAKFHRKVLDYILSKVPIMSECPFFNFYIIKMLAHMLLTNQSFLPLGTLETTNLLYYETDMREALFEANIVFGGSYLSRLPIYVRVNTLSISFEQCINAFCKEGWDLLQCPKSYTEYLAVVSQLKKPEFVRDFHISELLVFPRNTSFYNHPGYLRGKFVLQDKGSCLASFLLNPKPGARVYDMCAAPGQTTNHLANIINNEGIIYAVDNHPHRYNRLYSFLESTNTSCAETILGDHMEVEMDNVNYILFDAPSTYTGISFLEKKNELLTSKSEQYFRASVKALTYALLTFTTVKRVVFSSCSIFPEEGEKVVDSVLKEVGNSYDLLDVKELLWNEWLTVGDTNSGIYPSATKCLRTEPTIDKCQGYFIAVFERNFQVPVPPYRQDSSNAIEIRDDGANYKTWKQRYKLHVKILKKKRKARRFRALKASLQAPVERQNSNSDPQQIL